MKPYHQTIRDFPAETKEATRRLRRDWSTKDQAMRRDAMGQWLKEVSAVYGIRQPILVFNEQARGDHYEFYGIGSEPTIVMKGESIITLLHEFRHHMQCVGIVEIGHHQKEHDARAWSLSLYWQIAPLTLKRLAKANKIVHLDAKMRNRFARS